MPPWISCRYFFQRWACAELKMAAKTNMVKTSIRFLIPVKMLTLKYNALVNLLFKDIQFRLSYPQCSLLRSVLRKLWLLSLISLMSKSCFDSVITVFVSTVSDLESSDISIWGLRLSTLSVTTLLWSINTGRTFKLCGATGVMIKFDELGKIIGPPQLNE